jgi:hypothetical protein
MKEIKQLLAITAKLKANHGRRFTLDGKLVGDIGEVLVAEKYCLELLPESTPVHDAEDELGRKIQIKASFKNYCYFPGEGKSVPEYFLAVNITEDGELEELFNGPGSYLVEHYIKKRNLKKAPEYGLSPGVLKTIVVPDELQIKPRKKKRAEY